MKRLTVYGDERSLRYAFNLVITKGACSANPAVLKFARFAHMAGSEVYGGERGRSTLPVQRMNVGPLKSQTNYDTFSFTFEEMEAFVGFLKENGASCRIRTYGTANDFPELEIDFDDALLDKKGLTAQFPPISID